MSDPSLEVQRALFERLSSLGTAAGSRVFDRVQKNAVYPYVTIGPGQTVPVDETCWDRSEVSVQIDVWSREPGFPEAKAIAGAIRMALHEQSLAILGHSCDRVEVQSINFSRDPDGLTSRARIDVLVTTQPDE